MAPRELASSLLTDVTGGFHYGVSTACKPKWDAYYNAKFIAGTIDDPPMGGFRSVMKWMVEPVAPEPFNPWHPRVKRTQDAWQACEAAQP